MKNIRRVLNALARARMALAIICITIPVLMAALPAIAQEVLTRKDSFSTEIFLRIAPEQIRDIRQDGLSVTVLFQHSMRSPFSQAMDDPFIESIHGEGTEFTITFLSTADFAVVTADDGVRFIATRPRELDNVLLSYDMGAPLLRKENIFTDDPLQEAKLREFDKLMGQNQIYTAITEMENMLATTSNSFYRQEAMFRLGNAQMALGAYDQASYTDAANTFDAFISEFPESNKLMQVKLLTAEAREKAGSLPEAIKAYRVVYDEVADAETKRQMLLKIAEMNREVGQYDDAISTYEEYLANFRTDQDHIKTILGSLYIERVRQDDAYKMFSPVPLAVLTESLSEPELLTLAKIFQTKGDHDRALELFKYLGEADIFESTEALARMAEVYKELGDEENYSETLERVMGQSPDSEQGLIALIEYAELHYETQTGPEWRNFLDPIYKVEDTLELRPRAEMVQIRALLHAKDVFPLVNKIDYYVSMYPEENTNRELLQIKENVLFEKAEEFLAEDNDKDALTLFNQLLAQFPESPRVPVINQYIDDIYYGRALKLYNAANYTGASAAVEDRMLNSGHLLSSRWPMLLEDAKHMYIATGVGVLPTWRIRYSVRDYLAYFPAGRYVDELKGVLMQNFKDPYDEAFTIGDDAAVVRLYDENKSWLDQWPDQTVSNFAKIQAAQSLLRLGMRDQAEAMYKTITPMMNLEYAEVGYTLCQPNVIYNVNNLSPLQFEDIVSEAERCNDADYTLALVNKYTRDMKTALGIKYRVAKNITDDKRRERVLFEVYTAVNSDEANQFAGYEELYLDMGLFSYQKNDFSGALIPLQRYADLMPNTSEKKSEALYYIGKSLLAMNERARGMSYFRQITTTMPDSIYKNLANNELEEDAWRSNMNRN